MTLHRVLSIVLRLRCDECAYCDDCDDCTVMTVIAYMNDEVAPHLVTVLRLHCDECDYCTVWLHFSRVDQNHIYPYTVYDPIHLVIW